MKDSRDTILNWDGWLSLPFYSEELSYRQSSRRILIMENIVTLDECVNNMEEKPTLARKPSEPIDVAQAIALARGSDFNPANIPLCEIDALMYNGSFETVDKTTGETVTMNPQGKFKARIKDNDLSLGHMNLNDEAKLATLNNILRAILSNESSFDAQTFYNYARMSTNFTYDEVTQWAVKTLATMEKQSQLRCINPHATPFKTYAK